MTISSLQDTWAGHIAAKQQDIAGLEALYADLRDGTQSWRAWNPDLTCADRQDVAVEECGLALDEAKAELDELTKAATGRPEHGGAQ